MSIRLTRDEVWEFLATSHTGILTTLKADGWPVTLPMWFVVVDRTICFAAPSRTKKVARIRHDDRASFLVEHGQRWAELRAVHLHGTIDEVLDVALTEAIDARLEEKYGAFRTPRAQLPEAVQEHYTRRTFLRLTPGDRLLSWDNRRIPPAGALA